MGGIDASSSASTTHPSQYRQQNLSSIPNLATHQPKSDKSTTKSIVTRCRDKMIKILLCYSCCRERATDKVPSKSMKQEQSIHENQQPQQFDNDGSTNSVGQANVVARRTINFQSVNNTNLDKNVKHDHSDSMDQNDEMIGQQIVFNTDTSIEIMDEEFRPVPNRQAPHHTIVPSPSSLVYVKRNTRQYDMEEGKTFRRQQQQLQATKSNVTTTSSVQPPRTSTRTYVNGEVIDDDLFFDAKAE